MDVCKINIIIFTSIFNYKQIKTIERMDHDELAIMLSYAVGFGMICHLYLLKLLKLLLLLLYIKNY